MVAVVPGINGTEIRQLGKLVKVSRRVESIGSNINKLLKKDKSLRNSFENGKYSIVEATEDITVYRVSGGNSKKGTGAFFSTTKPKNSAQAEELLNINMWGNSGTEVTPVTIKKGTPRSRANPFAC